MVFSILSATRAELVGSHQTDLDSAIQLRSFWPDQDIFKIELGTNVGILMMRCIYWSHKVVRQYLERKNNSVMIYHRMNKTDSDAKKVKILKVTPVEGLNGWRARACSRPRCVPSGKLRYS